MKKFIVIKLFAIMCLFINTTQAQYSPVTNIKTPNNSTVSDCRVFTGTDVFLNSSQINQLINDLDQNYNGAELIGLPTLKYN